MVQWVNAKLQNECAEASQIFVFDFDGFLSRLGKDAFRDERMRFLAQMWISPTLARRLSGEYVRFALVESEERLKEAAKRIKKVLDMAS